MDYIQQFVALVDGVKLTLLIALILCNFITGIAVSIKTKTFNLKGMGDFLVTRIMPYIVGYFGVGLLALIESSWAWAVTAVWAVILATLVGALLQNLRELGISLPGSLGGGNNFD